MAQRKDSQADRATARAVNSGAIHLLRGVRRVDRLSGVTPARLSALSVLVFGGPRTLGHLAADEDVAGPTMTRIVDGLVALGLARRDTHPDSARSVIVSATHDGEELMRLAANRRVEMLVRALADLDDDERVLLQRAAPLLDRLADALWRVPVDPARPRRVENGQFDDGSAANI